MFVLWEYNSSWKHKHYALKTFVTRLRCIVYWMQQNTAPWYLFDFIIKKVGIINIALRYLPLEAIGKKLGKEKA